MKKIILSYDESEVIHNSRFLVTLIISLFISSTVISQPTLSWETDLDYRSLSATQGPAGNVFFLSGTGHLSKVDQSGNVLWQTDLNLTYLSSIYNFKDYSFKKLLASDAQGNVVVATTDFDMATGTYYCKTIKISNNGSVLWSKVYNTGTADIAHAVAIDKSDNIIVAGRTAKSGINTDFLVLKYDANGNQLWVSTFDGGSGDQAWDLTVDDGGNTLVTGGSNKFKNGSMTSWTSVAKFSPTGTLLWSSIYLPDDRTSAVGREVKVDNSGNVFVSGVSYSVNPDYFIVKYNSQGGLIWYKSSGTLVGYSSYFTNLVGHLALDAEGNVYMAGTRPALNNWVQDWNIWLWKFDSDGNVIFSVDYSCGARDFPHGIVVDNSENIYVTARSVSVPLAWSYATLKFDKNGSLIWSQGYGSSDDTPTQIFRNNHNIQVTGGVSKPNNQIKGLLLNYEEPSSTSLFSISGHGTKNTEVVIPIKANSFENILSTQFSVSWDPSVVTFVGVESFGLSGLDNNFFGTSNAGSGQLSFSWSEPSLSAQTLADGSALFNIRFKLTGNYGVETPVTINGQPLAIEVVDNNFETVDVTTQVGKVTIDPSIFISGKVLYPNSEAVQKVTVDLGGGTPQSLSTDALGYYFFEAPAGINYTLTPAKTNDPNALNGIDVQDVASVRRHILRVEALGGPYQIIAADVNKSSTVSTLDIDYIQALILGINDNFPNNNQWVFAPKNYAFPNMANPFPYPSSSSLLQIDGQVTQDFVAMKLGDVNNSRDNTQQNRQATNEVVFVIDGGKTRGDVFEVPIQVRNFEGISAYQFTVNWDPEKLEYIDVINENITGRFGKNQINKGTLTTLWDDGSGKNKDLNDESTLFRIQFRKKTSDAASRDINITSARTNIAVYDKNLKAMAYSIDRKGGEPSTEFELYQNFPNGFDEKTQISFDIPQRGEVSIEIIDATGRKVWSVRNDFEAGRNFVEWDSKSTTNAKISSGLYIYNAYYNGLTKSKRLVKK